VTQGEGGTVSGDYRATVVTSDGSVNCVTPAAPPVSVGTCALDETLCSGPVCPYEAAIATCFVSQCFASCMDPTDLAGCFVCADQCVVDSGIMDDAPALALYEALATCEEQAGCDDSVPDDAGVSECMKANCCDELVGAYN
jgi:hypothetical protein